jgi:hypothetical protein
MAPFQLYFLFLGNDNGHFAAALAVVRAPKRPPATSKRKKFTMTVDSEGSKG